ncbi:MAG TPA: NADP oxidoreductase, partial [Solirubrobacteraceae bacterium]|nr:NADP oxidoreductase [Solirubrobacteraceae bacterium]
KDANETVDLLLEDFASGRLPAPAESPEELIADLRERGTHVVEYSGWEAIDAHERSLGEPHGRPRVKLVRRLELLAVAAGEHLRGQ